MYLVITHFMVDAQIDSAELACMFESSAPRYAAIPGLLSKQYYIEDGDGGAGGVYLWERKEDADNFFDDTFRQTIAQRFGSLPTLRTMNCPIWLDNVHQIQRKG